MTPEIPKQVPFELLRTVMVDVDVVEAVARRVLDYVYHAGHIEFVATADPRDAIHDAVKDFLESAGMDE